MPLAAATTNAACCCYNCGICIAKGEEKGHETAGSAEPHVQADAAANYPVTCNVATAWKQTHKSQKAFGLRTTQRDGTKMQDTKADIAWKDRGTITKKGRR